MIPTPVGLSSWPKATCFASLQGALLAELEDSNAYYRTNACPLLDQKGVSAAKCKPEPVQAPEPSAPSPVLTRPRGFDWRKLTLDQGSAQRLLGPENEEVLVIRPKPPAPQDLVLIKFKGIRGPWNEQVIVTLESPAGLGTNFITLSDDSEYVAITVREDFWEAYPKGQRDPLRLHRTQLTDRKLEASSADVRNEFAFP
jgi:hypothetical protein